MDTIKWNTFHFAHHTHEYKIVHIIRKNLFDNMFILKFRIIIAKLNFFNSILIFIQLINFL